VPSKLGRKCGKPDVTFLRNVAALAGVTLCQTLRYRIVTSRIKFFHPGCQASCSRDQSTAIRHRVYRAIDLQIYGPRAIDAASRSRLRDYRSKSLMFVNSSMK